MRTNPVGIEKLIQDAQRDGKFDDLEGKGQPLNVGYGDLGSVFADVMRDNAIVPEWIELGRAIERLRARQAELIAGLEQRRAGDRDELDRALAARGPATPRQRMGWWRSGHRDRLRTHPSAIVDRLERDRRRTLLQVAEQVRAERRKVDRFNLVVPISGRQMKRVPVEERLAEFQERFPALALSESSGNWQLHERVEVVEPHLLTDSEDAPGSRPPARTTEQAAALKALRSAHRRPPPIG